MPKLLEKKKKSVEEVLQIILEHKDGNCFV